MNAKRITVGTQRAWVGERHHLTISDAITASRTDPKIRPYSQIFIEKKTRPPPLRSWGLAYVYARLLPSHRLTDESYGVGYRVCTTGTGKFSIFGGPTREDEKKRNWAGKMPVATLSGRVRGGAWCMYASLSFFLVLYTMLQEPKITKSA